MIVKHKLTLELSEKKNNPRVIYAAQGDSVGRALEIRFSQDGSPWSAPQDTRLQAQYRKPDGTQGIYDTLPDGTDAWRREGDVFILMLAPQVLTVAGDVTMRISLKAEGQTLSTFNLLLRIDPAPTDEEAASEDYFHYLHWIEAELAGKADQETVEATLQEAMESGAFTGDPGPQGPEGPQGPQGEQGEPGQDGLIPIAVTDSLPAVSGWSAMAYGNGLFTAIAYGGNQAAYSYDGIHWTAAVLPTAGTWQSLAYGGGVFVALSKNSADAAYSTDGITWHATTLPQSSGWSAVAWNGYGFVAISDSSASAAYSTDGITWSASSLRGAYSSIAAGNGLFVAVGSGTTECSRDGITWQISSMPEGDWVSVTYGSGLFVAITPDGTAAYSADGLTWTETGLPEGVFWSHISWGNGIFVALSSKTGTANQPSDLAAYSVDAITWHTATLPYSASWSSCAYGVETFVAIAGYTRAIACSKDAATWTPPDYYLDLDGVNVTQKAASALSRDLIASPASAAVGQTIVVKAVDENGKPTAWQAADFPEGGSGGEAFELIASGELTEETTAITITTDNNGNPFKLRRGQFMLQLMGTTTNTTDNGALRIRHNYNTAAKGSNIELITRIRNKASWTSLFGIYEFFPDIPSSSIYYLPPSTAGGHVGFAEYYPDWNDSPYLSALYLSGITENAKTMGVGTKWELWGVRA